MINWKKKYIMIKKKSNYKLKKKKFEPTKSICYINGSSNKIEITRYKRTQKKLWNSILKKPMLNQEIENK